MKKKISQIRQALRQKLSLQKEEQNLPGSSICRDADDSSFTDALLSGWFRNDTAELVEGFPISSQDIVLDVGSGDSPFLQFCAMQGAAVVFLDLDEQKICSMFEKLQNSHARSVTPIIGDATGLPLQNSSMSKIIAMEVMEHLDDPHVFLRELFRVGKPGAQYLITVPAPEAENLQKKIAPDSYFKKPNHIRVIERNEFARLVTEAGFIIENRKYYGFYWSIWWIFFWACKQELTPPWHPLLKSWAETWGHLLDTDQGIEIKKVLDSFLPKSQAIIARKP